VKENKEINTKHIDVGGIRCPCCYDRKIKLNKRARKRLKERLTKEIAELNNPIEYK